MSCCVDRFYIALFSGLEQTPDDLRICPYIVSVDWKTIMFCEYFIALDNVVKGR